MKNIIWQIVFLFLSLIQIDLAQAEDQRFLHTKEPMHDVSHAYKLADIILETIARDVERVGARPTIISRQMAIAVTAMYDAWALYDSKASPAYTPKIKRVPAAERSREKQKMAMSHAVYASLAAQFHSDAKWIEANIRMLEPKLIGHAKSTPSTSAEGIGHMVAQNVLKERQDDYSNHDGSMVGSNGNPYSDYTYYHPINPPSQIVDPDRWGPLPFSDHKGGIFHPGYLTPHWYLVKTFALKKADQFRPGPPPLVGSSQLKKEVDEVIAFNNSLTLEQKAVVEFMRDGPRSTGQSGHWLRFAQDVSRRDKYDLDQDTKLYFAIANVCLDAFIAAWEAKRFYDSSRPWHLVRHYYKDKKIMGWKGPGVGVDEIPAEEWMPYSPSIFITPPFPGYVSGHSTLSGAAAKMLEHFTGSDRYGFKEVREAGSMTEEHVACRERQKIKRAIAQEAKEDCTVTLDLPTFSATAEMAGISRIMGGYHIQADNVAGLKLGRDVANFSWPVYQAYFNGKR